MPLSMIPKPDMASLVHLITEFWRPDSNGKALGQLTRHYGTSDVALCKVKTYPENPGVDGDDTRTRYPPRNTDVYNDDTSDDVRCSPDRVVYVRNSGAMDQDDISREKQALLEHLRDNDDVKFLPKNFTGVRKD